jgi:hypothetical protein
VRVRFGQFHDRAEMPERPALRPAFNAHSVKFSRRQVQA